MDNRLAGASLALARQGFRALEWCNRKGSRIGAGPFYDPAAFPWIGPIERQWTAVLGELEGVLGRYAVPNFQDVLPGQDHLTSGDGWKSFMLFLLGRRIEQNCRACPRTAALLETVPEVKTAFFSILAPGKRIPPHRGPYNGVLRWHLALVVPAERERCRIRVGHAWAHWEPGASLVFDDTIVHEVVNDTVERRVVLFVDFLRPLRFPMSLLNPLIIDRFGASHAVGRRLAVIESLTRDGAGRTARADFS